MNGTVACPKFDHGKLYPPKHSTSSSYNQLPGALYCLEIIFIAAGIGVCKYQP